MSDKGATRIAFTIALLAISIAFSGWFMGSTAQRDRDQYVNYCVKELNQSNLSSRDYEHTCVGQWYNYVNK